MFNEYYLINNDRNLYGFKQKDILMAIALTSTAQVASACFFERLASLGKCKPSNTKGANTIDPGNSCKLVYKTRCQKDE